MYFVLPKYYIQHTTPNIQYKYALVVDFVVGAQSLTGREQVLYIKLAFRCRPLRFILGN